MRFLQRRAWLSWASVAALAILCAALGLLQYRWIGEIAGAERERLRDDLRTRLKALSSALDAEVMADCLALRPTAEAIKRLGRDRAYAVGWDQWQASHPRVFQRIALAVPAPAGVSLLLLDTATATFAPAEWPVEWAALRRQMEARGTGSAPGPAPIGSGAIFEIPRFGPPAAGGTPREQEWLLLELSTDYARTTLLPDMLSRFMGTTAGSDYDFEVTSRGNPSTVIFSAGNPLAAGEADAEIGLLNLGPGAGAGFDGGFDGATPEFAFRGPGRGRGGRGRGFGPPQQPRGPGAPRPGEPPFAARGRGPGRPPFDMSRWLLRARHRAGSLDRLVEQTRRRNLAVSGAILLLILATVVMLVRFSRQAQHLAALEMNFVAGISHELRTPLTVIRTAAYNLRSAQIASRPERVEQYGRLIEQESGKLEGLLAQVLQFASVQAGHAVRERTLVPASEVLAAVVQSATAALEGTGIALETNIAAPLPAILADRQALTGALENLLENARKYGTADNRWIGLSACVISGGKSPALEIRVADRGPGIPPAEQARIFDPFVRGQSAVRDQIRGTGLGLSLVKSIVEAHGGSIHVHSEAGHGTEFVVRIPVPGESAEAK